MFDVANYTVSGFAVPVWLVASLIIALGLVVLIGERGSWVSMSFWAMTLSAAVWLFSYGIAYCTPQPALALWWFKVGHLGIVAIPSAVYLFTLTIVRRVHDQAVAVLAAVAGSLVFGGIVWTMPFIRRVAPFAWGFYPQYGPLSVPFLGFFFTLLGSSLRLYWIEYRRTAGARQRMRLKAFLLAFSVAYLGSVDYVACYGVPWYPLGYLPVLGFIVLAAQAIWRYRLTDFSPAFAADTIVDTMNDALLVCDAEGTIQFVNAAACATLRFAERDLIGQPIGRLAGDRPEERERLRTLLRCDVVQDQEMVMWTRAGEPVEISLSVARLRQRAGERAPTGAVLIARDIRERKRAEKKEQQLAAAAQAAAAAVTRRAEELARAYDELKRTQAMLVQAEKLAAVGQLASGTAHEVRNPLSIIRMGTEHLERLLGRPTEGQAAEVLAMIKDAITRSDRIVRGLLDFSRPARLELKPIRVSTVVASALELSERQLAVQNVQVSYETDPEVPPVLADENQLKQVFINLIVNAFQAMPTGGGLTIRCVSRLATPVEEGVGLRSSDAFQPGDRVVICEVCDTGHGIPKAALTRIFDPFFTTKAPGDGTGLGLTITRTIIEQHGGRITVESEEGRGTRVRILLPIAESVNPARLAAVPDGGARPSLAVPTPQEGE